MWFECHIIYIQVPYTRYMIFIKFIYVPSTWGARGLGGEEGDSQPLFNCCLSQFNWLRGHPLPNLKLVLLSSFFYFFFFLFCSPSLNYGKDRLYIVHIFILVPLQCHDYCYQSNSPYFNRMQQSQLDKTQNGRRSLQVNFHPPQIMTKRLFTFQKRASVDSSAAVRSSLRHLGLRHVSSPTVEIRPPGGTRGHRQPPGRQNLARSYYF